MNRLITLASFALLCLFLTSHTAKAQSEVPKIEVGGHFSFIRFNYDPDSVFSGNPLGKMNYIGGGGRLTYNINKTYAIEGVVEGFPLENKINPNNGGDQEILPQPRIQGFFGVKAGVRRNNYGLFFKVRPGFTKYSATLSCASPNPCQEVKVTRFSLDVGGVIEGYLSKHFMVRADVGGTYLQYPSTTKSVVIDMQPVPRVFTREGFKGLNLQISAGIGFRF